MSDSMDPAQGHVLTRLHARHDKASLGEDLVFRAAKPIVGGREFLTDGKSLEQGWWGGPPPEKAADGSPKAAQGTAFIARDPTKVERLSESPIAELSVKGLKSQARKPMRKK